MVRDGRRSRGRDGLRGTAYLVALAASVLACGLVIAAATRLVFG